MAILACDDIEKLIYHLLLPPLLPVVSLSILHSISRALYLLNTAYASVGLQLITGVITHILDDLIVEKTYKSS